MNGPQPATIIIKTRIHFLFISSGESIFLLLPFLCFLSILGCEEQTSYLDLAWGPNQEPDLAGYKVYYGTSSREYINFIDVGNVTTYRLDNLLEDVEYYIAVTAYDMSGNESDFSEEVSGIGAIGG